MLRKKKIIAEHIRFVAPLHSPGWRFNTELKPGRVDRHCRCPLKTGSVLIKYFRAFFFLYFTWLLPWHSNITRCCALYICVFVIFFLPYQLFYVAFNFNQLRIQWVWHVCFISANLSLFSSVTRCACIFYVSAKCR